MRNFVFVSSTNEWDVLPKQKQQHKHKQIKIVNRKVENEQTPELSVGSKILDLIWQESTKARFCGSSVISVCNIELIQNLLF